MEYILQTNQVSKTIGGKSLVSNIDLHVKKGEIYGFLGLNGLRYKLKKLSSTSLR